jgi:hypothetical protein
MGDEGFSHEGWEEPVEDLYVMEGTDFDWRKYIHDVSLPLPSQRGDMNNKLPPGWRVENLGMIEAVEFSHPERPYKLLWCDGRWSAVHGKLSLPAPGVTQAKTMAEARKAGTEFIIRVESGELG